MTVKRRTFLTVIFSLTALLLIPGCDSSAKDDYTDISIDLVDHNGEDIRFPDGLKGKPVVMGFIYTNCPDICSFITANLYKVYKEMGEPDDIQFVLVTFDPERDTPEVLQNYAEAFNMATPPFRFLTGNKDAVDAFMQRMGVRSQVSYTKLTEDGSEHYFLNHSDKILLIDKNARLVMEYGGSMTPARFIVDDLKKL